MSTTMLSPAMLSPSLDHVRPGYRASRLPRCSDRRCIGLALVHARSLTGVGRSHCDFAPNDGVHWLSLIDRRHERRGTRAGMVLASWHIAQVWFGMPILGRHVEVCCKLPRRAIADKIHARAAFPVPADISKRGNTLAILAAIDEAMTTAAAPAESGSLHRFERAQNPEAWMPRAYLGFRSADRDRLFAWSTSLADGSRHYPVVLKRRFCEDLERCMPIQAPCAGTFIGAFRSVRHGLATLDLAFETRSGERQVVSASRQAQVLVLPSQSVREGDLAANDGCRVPADRDGMSMSRRWSELQRSWGCRLPAWIRLWFDRQIVSLTPGRIHLPSDLACLAARDHAVPEELHWNLAPAMGFYRQDLGAYILPPLPLKSRRDFTGRLPGEIAFDFNPANVSFVCSGCLGL